MARFPCDRAGIMDPSYVPLDRIIPGRTPFFSYRGSPRDGLIADQIAGAPADFSCSSLPAGRRLNLSDIHLFGTWRAHVTRVRLIPPDGRTTALQELFDRAQTDAGAMSNMVLAMANAPGILRSYLAFDHAVREGKLSARLQAQIALTLGNVNSCEYCLAAHTATSERLGLREHDIQAALDGHSPDTREDVVLQFARRVVEYRGDLTGREFYALRDAGYSDEDIDEVIGAVLLNIFTNYFNAVLQTEPEASGDRADCGGA